MKKVLSYALSLFMLIGLLMIPSFEAQAANVSLSVSSPTVNIGDSVKITVSVPDGTTATVELTEWSGVLSFTSASVDVGANGGKILINLGKMSMANSNSVTLTFKAATSGSANVKATVVSAVDNNTVEDVALGGASTTVKVENKVVQPEPEKSGDNSLSSLKLSKGTLSPKFKYSTTKYTATVDYDVKKVVVSAKTSNAKATIESITGDGTVNLKVGENTIEIVVKAENGVKAKYTIVVTRKEKPASEAPQPSESESTQPSESETTTPPPVNEALKWNGEQLYVVDKIPAESTPKDFESTVLAVNGQQMQGLSFGKGDLKVLYLNNTNGAGSLYVFDEEQQTIYPFIKISAEQSYVMVLMPNEEKETVPAGFESCTFSIEGKGTVNAYRLKEATTKVEETQTTSWNIFAPETFYAAPAKESEFYLIYCMNNNGEKGWYLYDTVEETFQRYLAVNNNVQNSEDEGSDTEQDDTQVMAPDKFAELEKELKNTKMIQYIAMGVAGLLAIIVIVLIILLAKKKNNQEDDFFEGYEEDEYEEDDEVEVEFYNMEESIVKETLESEKVASNTEEASDDLEFIDFE